MEWSVLGLQSPCSVINIGKEEKKLNHNMNTKARLEKAFQRAFDLNESLKRIDRSEDELMQLRQLVNHNEKLPQIITDKHLAVFLADDVTVQQAYEKIILFFNLKRNSPEVFRNRDPFSDELAVTFMNQNFFYLPTTPDGYSVIYGSLKDYSVSTFVFDSMAKAFFMTAEACFFHQGPQRGIIFLVDMAGGKLFHLTKINLKTIKMGLRFALDACPQKIIGFHILNAVPFYELIMQIMKPFARKELKLLLNLHYADIDWENFYANHIPRSSLPSDYGGDLESIEKLSKKNLHVLQKLTDYYEVEEEDLFGPQIEESTAM